MIKKHFLMVPHHRHVTPTAMHGEIEGPHRDLFHRDGHLKRFAPPQPSNALRSPL